MSGDKLVGWSVVAYFRSNDIHPRTSSSYREPNWVYGWRPRSTCLRSWP